MSPGRISRRTYEDIFSNPNGVKDSVNNLCAYTIAKAESLSAAAKIFENHPLVSGRQRGTFRNHAPTLGLIRELAAYLRVLDIGRNVAAQFKKGAAMKPCFFRNLLAIAGLGAT